MLRITTLGVVVLLTSLGAEKPAAQSDPKVSSIFPLGGKPGEPYQAEIHGRNLKGARSLWFAGSGVQARVLSVDAAKDSNAKDSNDVVHAELVIEQGAAIGAHPFRVVTPMGISNS